MDADQRQLKEFEDIIEDANGNRYAPRREPRKYEPLDYAKMTQGSPLALHQKMQAGWCSFAEAVRKKLRDKKVLTALSEKGVSGFLYDPAKDNPSALLVKAGESADYVIKNIERVIK